MLSKGHAGAAYNVGSEDGRPLRAIAERVAEITGTRVHVVQEATVERVAAPERYVPSTRLAREQLEELVAEARLGRTLAGLHFPAGDPASAVPQLAEGLDADLVVLGSAGHMGLAGVLIGGTAEAIVTRMARSVAVVKPAGYVSPVRPVAAAARA